MIYRSYHLRKRLYLPIFQWYEFFVWYSCLNFRYLTNAIDWYSQCVPGTAATTAKTTTKATTTAAATTKTTTAGASNPTPTLYLCGDSTMAKNGANDGSTDGMFIYT